MKIHSSSNPFMAGEKELLDKLASLRTNDLSEPLAPYLELAAVFETGNRHELKSRASFIRDQCKGFDVKQIFDKYREKWQVPKFEGDLVRADDFKRGFLFRFRDHTTEWKEAQKAKTWFLHSA